MDIPESRLDSIESQSIKDVSHGQNKQRYFSMEKISNSFRTIYSRVFFRSRGEAMLLEPVPEFLTNLKFSDLFDFPGEYVLVNAKMLSTMSDGNEEALEKLKSHGTPLACLKNDTALNYAMKGRHMAVAMCLVNVNRQASFLASKDGISPLYLALESGYMSLVKKMLGNDDLEETNLNLEGRKYLVHAAMKSISTDMLDLILNKYPSLVNERDEEGRTCISYGISIGNYRGVYKLLDQSTEGVFVCDDDGSYPIHIAIKEDHLSIVEEILQRCPFDSSQNC